MHAHAHGHGRKPEDKGGAQSEPTHVTTTSVRAVRA